MMQQKSVRLFIGIAFDREFWNGVKGIFKILTKKHWHVRFASQEKLHITLLFLGEVDREKINRLTEVIADLCKNIPPFRLAIKGLGGFPTLFLPVVIWLGLRGDLHALYRLRKGLEECIRQLGLDYDDTPYTPHVTIGRLQRNTSRRERLEIGRQLTKLRVMDMPHGLVVDRIRLYASTLSTEGSVYDVVSEFPFGGTIPSNHES